MMYMLSTRGIPLAIASGRTYPALRRLFSPYDAQLLYFPLDGALAVADDTLLCGFPLGISSISSALPLLSLPQVRGVEFCTFRNSNLISEETALIASEHQRLGEELSVVSADTTLDVQDPIYKIIVFTKRTGAPVPPPDGTRAVYRSAVVTEFVRADVSKRKAAEIVCEALHISPDEVLAYGDSDNDRELLQFAKTAVAVRGTGWGHDLSSITNYYTQNAAESVMRFLKRDEDAARHAERITHYGKIQHH